LFAEYVEPYLFVQSQSALEVIEVSKKLCTRSPTPSTRRLVDYDRPFVIGSAGAHVLVSVWSKPCKTNPATNMVDLIALTGRAFFDSDVGSVGSGTDLSVDSGAHGLTDSDTDGTHGTRGSKR
jgi:hypothetical protein